MTRFLSTFQAWKVAAQTCDPLFSRRLRARRGSRGNPQR